MQKIPCKKIKYSYAKLKWLFKWQASKTCIWNLLFLIMGNTYMGEKKKTNRLVDRLRTNFRVAGWSGAETRAKPESKDLAK